MEKIMNNLSLDSRNWDAFFIEDVAEILSGRDIYERERLDGLIPYITATANNNGIGYFVANSNETLESNCLSVNRNGSVGYCFYHPYKALYGNDTRKLRPKKNNKYVSLFISLCITKQREKYGYGYKMGTGRLKRQRILLPIDENNNPDWQFMEDYMKAKEQQILKPTIEKLCKHLIFNEIATGGGKLSHAHWKAFYFTEVFTEIQRGKRLKKADHSEGKTPYISATALNNGVDGFVGNESGVRKFSNCLTVANSGSVGSAFFHQYEFVASDHVTQLKREGLDKYAYLFMLPLINRLSEKYSFNREINDNRIKREKLILPATQTGEIDFAFMSSFMKEIEQDILNTTLKVFKNRASVNKCKLGGVIWKNFLIRDLFPILVPGKSKGLNHIEKVENGISYLGATNQNNGVLCFVTANKDLVQKGNCIAFIRNGEGSMGYSVYKAEDFIATSDMTLGYNENLNKYIGTFITTVADRIRGKYNFGYKRSATRLVKEVLTLPVDKNGQPYWEYMENYMRNIENQQIFNYFKTLGLIK